MLRSRVQSHVAQAAQVTPVRPAYAAGARAAIATVLPIVIGGALGFPGAAWMGLAGFNVVLVDKGGTLRTRVAAMLSASMYGAVAVVVGAIAGRHVWTAVGVTALWAIAAGLARTYGAIGTSAGIVSLVTLVVSLATPASTSGALERGAASLAGTAFAVVLALVAWPVRLYRPARRDAAKAYRLLANLTREPRDSTRAAAVADAVDCARATLAALRRSTQGASHRAERLLVLTEIADRLARDYVKIGAARPDEPAVLEAIAATVERETNEALPLLGAGAPDLLERAVSAARELNDGPVSIPLHAAALRARYIAPVFDNLTWDSTVLRHALRVAVASAIAVFLTTAGRIDHGYWLTLTVIVILQPYTSATFQKGLQRIAGTILGGVAAAVLLSVVHSVYLLLALIFIGAAVTVAVMPLNYALYSLAVTTTFVLLAEVHASDWHLALVRVSNTIGGAILAYVAAWILWPASERGRLRDDLSAALRVLGDHLACIADCDDLQVERSRRSMSVALQNAEASIQRLLSDESSESPADAEAMLTVVVYSRRLARAVDELRARVADPLKLVVPMLRASRTLSDLASAVQSAAPPPAPAAVAGDEAVAPVFEALAALHHTVERLASPDPAPRDR